MKKLIIILILSACTQLQALNLPYTESHIQWLGRWITNPGVGKWTAWGGSQIVFKVHGTTTIKLNANVVDPDATNYCPVELVIDNSAAASTIYLLTTAVEVYTGTRTATWALPDTLVHTIIIHLNGLSTAMFNATQNTTVKSFDVDATGGFYTWTQGTKVIQTVGDSWCSADNDWPRLMNRNKWQLYPVGEGGLTCTNMNTEWGYNYTGVTQTDPDMNCYTISFGVNDYNAHITNSTFQGQLSALLHQLQMVAPTVPIYLIQIPKNVGANKDYGRYGDTAMVNMAAIYKNVYYISTRSIENSLSWTVDNSHLDSASKIIMANYVDVQITNYENNGKVVSPKVTNLFTFHEGSGTTVNDKVGSATGTLQGTVSLPVWGNGYLTFVGGHGGTNGNWNRVIFTNTTWSYGYSTEFTEVVVFRSTKNDAQVHELMSTYNLHDNGHQQIRLYQSTNNNGLFGRVYTSSGSLSHFSTSYPTTCDGNWHVAIMVYSINYLTVYLDGNPLTMNRTQNISTGNFYNASHTWATCLGTNYNGSTPGNCQYDLSGNISYFMNCGVALGNADISDIVNEQFLLL